MILKLDMEKAYDRLEWGFLAETLRDARLLDCLIRVVKSLIRQSHCKLLWNGELMDTIRSTRGLRQGDPCRLIYLFS